MKVNTLIDLETFFAGPTDFAARRDVPCRTAQEARRRSLTHYSSRDPVLIENNVLDKSRRVSSSVCKSDVGIPFKISILDARERYFGGERFSIQRFQSHEKYRIFSISL